MCVCPLYQPGAVRSIRGSEQIMHHQRAQADEDECVTTPITPNSSASSGVCRRVLSLLLEHAAVDNASSMALGDICRSLDVDAETGRQALAALEFQSAVRLYRAPRLSADRMSMTANDHQQDAAPRASTTIAGPLLTAADIRRALCGLSSGGVVSTAYLNPSITIHDSVGSTNTLAMQALLEDGVDRPVLMAAEAQPLGRGSHGRRWYASAWRNLICSFGWRMRADVTRISGLSLVAGLCLADIVAELGMTDLALKWPNDLLVGDNKLAGILIEAQRIDAWVAPGTQETALVCGVGMNIDVEPRQAVDIDQPWCDLSRLGRKPDRNVLVAKLFTRLGSYLEQYPQRGFEPFVERYAQRDWLRGKHVSITLAGDVHHGVARGVDGLGRLLLESNAGIRPFTSGHVALAGCGAGDLTLADNRNR